METAIATPRCVVIVNSDLAAGRAANAAAVLALTMGQRHPWLVGGALVDASGFPHPGLIPIGIAVLAAGTGELAAIRGKGIVAGCDVVDFPTQGQQTTDYAAFQTAVLAVPTDDLSYVGVALLGEKKAVGKIVANLGLLK
ncbi:MAG: DUF2000 domain-containing protein [Pseudomonadota bacterium]|jgi:hypothetical protein